MINDKFKIGLVIGAGPAGLMAAEQLALAGLKVIIVDRKPSAARKFLMAGKSGLNLTKNENVKSFLNNIFDTTGWLNPIIDQFGPERVIEWVEGLGEDIFIGSSGRVFPRKMKASHILRSWFGRLDNLGVELKTRWNWTGWENNSLSFETPDGFVLIDPLVTVLALGGGSWPRLGSNGSWVELLKEKSVAIEPLTASNVCISINWSEKITPYIGTPLKNIAFGCGAYKSRGEAIITSQGFEGGGAYSMSSAIRSGQVLKLDLLPDLSESSIFERLKRRIPKMSLANHLRKSLRLDPVKISLLNEFARPLPTEISKLAFLIKNLIIKHDGLGPLDKAISSAGGVKSESFDSDLMLKSMPGVFVAGEMLNWDAPTGGYLINTCLATGRLAGKRAAEWAELNSAPAAL
jgi:uncharacterized flavoprotein (TIGR03862 family)